MAAQLTRSTNDAAPSYDWDELGELTAVQGFGISAYLRLCGDPTGTDSFLRFMREALAGIDCTHIWEGDPSTNLRNQKQYRACSVFLDILNPGLSQNEPECRKTIVRLIATFENIVQATDADCDELGQLSEIIVNNWHRPYEREQEYIETLHRPRPRFLA